jgi:hypothetical protein
MELVGTAASRAAQQWHPIRERTMNTFKMSTRNCISVAFCVLSLAGAGFGAPPDSRPADGNVKGPLVSDKELFAALDLDRPGMESVKKAVAGGDIPAAKAAYLEYCRTGKVVKWRIDPSAKPKTAVAKDDPVGDRICKHFFAMPWGEDTKPYFVGEKIDWSFNPNKPTDPAHTNEWTYIAMNRMYDWNRLGEAYWKTLDEKYAKEWVAQMEDWVRENPVAMDAWYGHTLNWRTLEAGLRMGGGRQGRRVQEVEVGVGPHVAHAQPGLQAAPVERLPVGGLSVQIKPWRTGRFHECLWNRKTLKKPTSWP